MAYLDVTGLNTLWAKIKNWVVSQGYLTQHQDISGKQDALSQAQLNAVNSGITSGKVSAYDGYASVIASKLSDAPNDGKSYGRKNSAWVEISGGDIQEYTSSEIETLWNSI